MTSKALTERKLQQLRPSEKRQEIADGLLRGLYFIVQPSNAKSWAVRYRIHGKTPVKETLGTWPTMSLKAAREAGRDKILAAKAGRDPRAERIAARAKAEADSAGTVRAVTEAYLARESSKLRTGNERRRLFERLVYPAFGGRPIGTITRGELIKFLDRVEDENGTRMADVTLAAIRRVMNWHAVRDESFRTIVVRGMARQRVKDITRTRILSDDELRKIWTTATALPGPFPVFVRFLLLTAARRGEAARMTWSEVVDGDWILPAARNKVKEDLVRPLSEAARGLLAGLSRFPDGNDFVFTHDGRRAIGAFGRLKASFDARCGVTSYVLHDLRRSARSLMSRAGVPTDHAERVLGHVIGGVRGVYDRHEFHAEKKAALEALAVQIQRIIDPQPNVLSLRGKVAASDERA